MHARYCSPLLGRFLSVDRAGASLRAPQTLNRYAYVANNPLNYVDPTGLAMECVADEDGNVFCGDSIEVVGEKEDLEPLEGGAGDSILALLAWSLGALPPTGVATPEMVSDLANTPGMENIRTQFEESDCAPGRYWTDYQYGELLTTRNATGQMIGGFVADITPVNGNMVVNAQNTWGLESATRFPGRGNRGNASVQQMLFGGAPLQYPKSLLENRAAGPKRNATLHFIWAEPSPCENR